MLSATDSGYYDHFPLYFSFSGFLFAGFLIAFLSHSLEFFLSHSIYFIFSFSSSFIDFIVYLTMAPLRVVLFSKAIVSMSLPLVFN